MPSYALTLDGAFCCMVLFSLPPFFFFPPSSLSGMTQWKGGSRSGSSAACCWPTAGCSPRNLLSCWSSSRSISKTERSVASVANLRSCTGAVVLPHAEKWVSNLHLLKKSTCTLSSSVGRYADFAGDKHFASSRAMEEVGVQWSVSSSAYRLVPIKMDAVIFKI